MGGVAFGATFLGVSETFGFTVGETPTLVFVGDLFCGVVAVTPVRVGLIPLLILAAAVVRVAVVVRVVGVVRVGVVRVGVVRVGVVLVGVVRVGVVRVGVVRVRVVRAVVGVRVGVVGVAVVRVGVVVPPVPVDVSVDLFAPFSGTGDTDLDLDMGIFAGVLDADIAFLTVGEVFLGLFFAGLSSALLAFSASIALCFFNSRPFKISLLLLSVSFFPGSDFLLILFCLLVSLACCILASCSCTYRSLSSSLFPYGSLPSIKGSPPLSSLYAFSFLLILSVIFDCISSIFFTVASVSALSPVPFSLFSYSPSLLLMRSSNL